MTNTRQLTEGAVLLAIYAVLLLGSLYIPLVSIVMTFVLPLPFILFTMRHQLKGTVVLFIAAALLTFIISTPFDVFRTLMLSSAGAVQGWMYKRQKGQMEVLLAGTGAVLINLVILYAVSIQFFGIDILNIKEMQTMLLTALQTAEQSAGSANGANLKSLEQFRQAIQFIPTIIPVIFVTGAATISLFIQLLTAPILRKLRFEVPAWPPLRSIQVPRFILILYVLALLVSIITSPQAGTLLHTVLLNVNIVLQFLFFIQGISFIAYFSYIKGYPKAVLIVLIVLSLLMPILFSIYIFLGIIDLGVSLRKLLKRA